MNEIIRDIICEINVLQKAVRIQWIFMIGALAESLPKKPWSHLRNRASFSKIDRSPALRNESNKEPNHVPQYLQGKGIKKEDQLSVFLRNCPEFLEVHFAAPKPGIIVAPLNFPFVGTELEYQPNDFGACLLVFQDSLVDKIAPIYSLINGGKG